MKYSFPCALPIFFSFSFLGGREGESKKKGGESERKREVERRTERESETYTGRYIDKIDR